MFYYVYILYSPVANKYYIGSCADIENRIKQHNSGRNKSTKSGIPWDIKKIEEYPTLTETRKREFYIKRMKSRKFIELVIAGCR